MLPGCEVDGPLLGRIKEAVGPLDLYGLEWPVCLDPEQAQGRSQRHALVSLLGLVGQDGKAGKDEPFVPCEEVRGRELAPVSAGRQCRMRVS